MIILAIESSCDETAAAVVESGTRILSSVVSSQVAVHHQYGGVVPELASRKHIEAIVPVVSTALDEAGMSYEDLDAIAATQGPGLVGSLLVGFCFAKAQAFALNIPWIGVNHLEGHVNSVFLGKEPPQFPFVALLVSGGHTAIYYVRSHISMELMGQTRDDAAGEAFDKVAKMLGLGYPGGIVIDRLSLSGDPAKIKFPRAYLDKSKFDFSFSGVKTAVNRYIQTHPEPSPNEVADIVASFQEAVVDVLTFKLLQAAKTRKCPHMALVGGVAANSHLWKRVQEAAQLKGMSCVVPSKELCGDNAAMIATAGYHRLIKGMNSRFDSDVFSKNTSYRPLHQSP